MAYPNKVDMKAMFDLHVLDWKILAIEGETVNQTQILKFMNDERLYNAEGDSIGTEVVTDLTGKLPVFAGHKWSY